MQVCACSCMWICVPHISSVRILKTHLAKALETGWISQETNFKALREGILTSGEVVCVYVCVCLCVYRCVNTLLRARVNDTVLLKVWATRRLVSGAEGERRCLIGQREHRSTHATGWLHATGSIRHLTDGEKRNRQKREYVYLCKHYLNMRTTEPNKANK